MLLSIYLWFSNLRTHNHEEGERENEQDMSLDDQIDNFLLELLYKMQCEHAYVSVLMS